MIDQIAISVFGVASVWLSQDSRQNVRRYACLFGLASQPFWFWSAYAAEQWGILVLSLLYTVSWVRGIYSNWVLPRMRVQQSSALLRGDR